MEKVQVNASKVYNIIIDNDLLSQSGAYIKEVHKPCKVFLVTDKTVSALYGKTVISSLSECGFEVHSFSFEAGEGSKNMNTISLILEQMAEKEFTRSDLIVALGGGIVGDIAGFAAAVFLRGIAFIQIPTTLLAAVDSSVGGKTGVNLNAGKNLAGAFWQPSLVLCDCNTFKTLPYDTFLDGIAEAVKYGVICDKNLFDDLFLTGKELYQGCGDTEALKSKHNAIDTNIQNNTAADKAITPALLVKRCVSIKADIVANDERDTGLRQLLNLGHTIGHAIEKVSSFKITHGHAVALGMLMISKACADMKICGTDCYQAISDILMKFGFPIVCPFSADELSAVMLKDKKRSGKNITLVLPEAIGKCRLEKISIEQLEKYIVKIC